MNNLLIDEPPLQVLPTLAVKIGLNEAMVLQQIHYWLKYKKNFINGHYWVFNTVEDWQAQFKFWSPSTIQRTLLELRKIGVLVGQQLSKDPRNRVMYYRIDYEVMKRLASEATKDERDSLIRARKQFDASTDEASPQDGMHEVTTHEPSSHFGPMSIYTETTSETTSKESTDPVHPQADRTTPQPPQEKKKQIHAMDEVYPDHLFADFWAHYPRKEGKAEAQKAWAKKVIGQGAAEQAIEAIKQRIGINSQEKKFIPLAGTWINKERWKDLDTSPGVYSDLFERNDISEEATAIEEPENTPPPIAAAPLHRDRAQIEALILSEAEEAGDWRILGDARALADEVARRMRR